MSKDDNIGTAVIKKAMEYFMIKWLRKSAIYSDDRLFIYDIYCRGMQKVKSKDATSLPEIFLRWDLLWKL